MSQDCLDLHHLTKSWLQTKCQERSLTDFVSQWHLCAVRLVRNSQSVTLGDQSSHVVLVDEHLQSMASAIGTIKQLG